jgi:Domain of unknown function (DUF4124)
MIEGNQMRYSLLILASLFSASASADIYKCTDANGHTEYRSSPCKTGNGNIKLNIKTGTYTDVGGKENPQQQTDQKKQAEVNREASIESAANQLLIKNNPDKFSPYAIPPYNPENLPDLVKTYQDRLPEIERLRRQAAEKALASDQCARVESVELNSKSTKDALVFFINCSNGTSFYFKEQELMK